MKRPVKSLLVMLVMLLMFSSISTSVLAMGNSGNSMQPLPRMTIQSTVPLRERTPLLRLIRESNLLSRNILALKIEVTALQAPLMETIQELVNSPDDLTGDQLVALKDAILILKKLRLEVRHVNVQLLEQRLAWREHRLERNTTAAATTLEEMITLQQQAVKNLESSIRMIHKIQEGL